MPTATAAPLKLTYPSCGVECAQFAPKVVKNSTTGALAAPHHPREA